MPWKNFTITVIIFFLSLYSSLQLYNKRTVSQIDTITPLSHIPSSVIQTASLEFKGITADFLFLRILTFVGYKLEEKVPVTREEWDIICAILERITDLDPSFWDPYVFTEMMLAWQAGMIDEANHLLLKASGNRQNDYRPLYYIGFNYLYFKKDFKNASRYLQKAAKISDAPLYLKGLAARVGLYGNETNEAVIFLEKMIQTTSDPNLRSYLKKRYDALTNILFLEQTVQKFRELHNGLPSSLEELVKAGLLDQIPEDPYGGTFMLLQNGRIYTTSKLIDQTKPHPHAVQEN